MLSWFDPLACWGAAPWWRGPCLAGAGVERRLSAAAAPSPSCRVGAGVVAGGSPGPGPGCLPSAVVVGVGVPGPGVRGGRGHAVGFWGIARPVAGVCRWRGRWCGVFGCWIVDASIFVVFVLCVPVCSAAPCPACVCCWGWVWWQAGKGTWWMPWHQEPMKDVGACDKPWGVGNRAVIRGCPNGETWLESCPATRA